MYTEALNTYQVISKNRLFQNGARMRVNVANIYEKIGQPEKAIKMYRMALDQVPNINKSFKLIKHYMFEHDKIQYVISCRFQASHYT